MECSRFKCKITRLRLLNYVCDFDVLLLNETWNASRKNVNIDGYDCFNCPRPKSNSKAKRCSGGVIVYYKSCYKNYFHLLNIDCKGLIWFKLDKQFLQSDKDAYFAYVIFLRKILRFIEMLIMLCMILIFMNV